MTKMLLAAAAAFALASAAPAYAAGCAHCDEKDKVAAAGGTEKAEKKEVAKADCKCPGGDGHACKCAGDKCECGHCHPKLEKKDEAKKS